MVVPGLPHHIIQRGNRRLTTFFYDEDYLAYKNIMAQCCARWNIEVWAYCLMPNHVHLAVVPPSENSLCRAIGEGHRIYAVRINAREEWKGHLWQYRFASYPMDESYLYAAVRYIELNPVRAKLVQYPWDYRWSSAAAHIAGKDDCLVKVKPLLEKFGDWHKLLADDLSKVDYNIVRTHEKSGRPLGDANFIAALEEQLGRSIQPRLPGRRGGQD